MRIPKWFLIIFIAVSFVGFLDAAYLTVQHYNKGILPCYIFSGCDKVLASSYAAVAGVPVSLFGALFYFLILAAAVFYIDTKHKAALTILVYLPIAGFAATLWLFFLQLFVIKAICFYCVVSAVSSTLLFGLGIYLWFLQKRPLIDK